MFSPDKLQEFEIMLSQDLLDNGKDLLKAIPQLDVKLQVKLILDIIDGVLKGKENNK